VAEVYRIDGRALSIRNTEEGAGVRQQFKAVHERRAFFDSGNQRDGDQRASPFNASGATIGRIYERNWTIPVTKAID